MPAEWQRDQEAHRPACQRESWPEPPTTVLGKPVQRLSGSTSQGMTGTSVHTELALRRRPHHPDRLLDDRYWLAIGAALTPVTSRAGRDQANKTTQRYRLGSVSPSAWRASSTIAEA
jgi:hypothetical protein